MTYKRYSIDDAKKFLTSLAGDLSYETLTAACLNVIEDPRFASQYGSAGEHHAYVGGLAIHTAEVTNYAYEMCGMFEDADYDVVVTAAIFHDYMKVKEYELRLKSSPDFIANPATGGRGNLVINEYGYPATYIGKTDYRNLVRHVAGSHAEFMKLVDGTDVNEEKIMKIEHAILAHHGRKEWGSPIEPQTVEAYILHNADMYSVKFGPGSRNK